jgi:hypothetical protein
VAWVLRGAPPIPTRLTAARWAVDSLDNFTPREAKRSLMQLQRTPNGGFVLQPGYYRFHDQSYCLKAGTHGPGGGDGYIYAPTRGPAEDAVMTIVRGSVNHPEIDQHDIQVLLWAIIARSKFEDLDTRLKATAGRLLTPRQLASLNRTALDLVPGPALDAATNSLPPLVRQVCIGLARARQYTEQDADQHAFQQQEQPLREIQRPCEPQRAHRREQEVIGAQPGQHRGEQARPEAAPPGADQHRHEEQDEEGAVGYPRSDGQPESQGCRRQGSGRGIGFPTGCPAMCHGAARFHGLLVL